MSEEGPFIFWDGEETKDKGYCLFGASVAGARPDSTDYIQAPFLRTRQMLDLLLDVSSRNKPASHVAFAFDYDVNQILESLNWRALAVLRSEGMVKWNEYTIEHIPGKIFKVSKDKQSIRIDDIFSFFRCRYDKALRKYGVGDSEIVEEISRGKDARSDFWYKDIDSIRHYWGCEVSLGCQLMDKIRKMAHRAGFHVKQWYGPGALAAYSLKQNKVTSLMASSPEPVHRAALSAYAGGWFERFRMGVHYGPTYTYDINSAYVYAMSKLPDLSTGTWRYVSRPDADLAASVRFGLFHVYWNPDFATHMQSCKGVPLPLFHRDNDGSIHRPVTKTSVWLWNPEASNAAMHPAAKLKEAWIYEDDGSYPFSWVGDMYTHRLALQAENDPSEKILKWAMASYYGRLAQRTGWDEKNRKAPELHQIEYAGWITSWCRYMVYNAGRLASKENGLVSIDTDGIISTVRLDNLENGYGNQLGRWKAEEYDALIYLQNGVYWLREAGKWLDPKLRGIPRAKMDPSLALAALDNDGKLSLDRRTFVGYGAALHRNRDEWRTWQDRSFTINAQQCGAKIHVPQGCPQCSEGFSLTECLHDLWVLPPKKNISKPHSLPWLEPPKKSDRFSNDDYEQVELF